jgi:hypothetical protein
VPPFDPLPPDAVDVLVRFLEGQSLIRAAFYVGLRSRPWPRASVRTADTLWLDVAGRRRGRVARRALAAGLGSELRPALLAAARPGGIRRDEPRPWFSWNVVTSRMLREAGSAAEVLWRAPRPAPDGLDPLDYALEWRPLTPPPRFAKKARALLERCSAIQRAWLAEEVLLKDGTEIATHANLYFESTDRRWPRETAEALMKLRTGEWSSFGVGRVDQVAIGARNATELFHRQAPA